MAAVWLWVRSERRRRGPALLIAAIVALAAGAGMAALAGARRADSALERFGAATGLANVELVAEGLATGRGPIDTARLDESVELIDEAAAVPGVEQVTHTMFWAITPEPDAECPFGFGIARSTAAHPVGVTIAGRASGAADEVWVNETDRGHVRTSGRQWAPAAHRQGRRHRRLARRRGLRAGRRPGDPGAGHRRSSGASKTSPTPRRRSWSSAPSSTTATSTRSPAVPARSWSGPIPIGSTRSAPPSRRCTGRTDSRRSPSRPSTNAPPRPSGWRSTPCASPRSSSRSSACWWSSR